MSTISKLMSGAAIICLMLLIMLVSFGPDTVWVGKNELSKLEAAKFLIVGFASFVAIIIGDIMIKPAE